MKYDVVVLGFGKAGKTLAAKFAKSGKKVALIEENAQMYGGTCINIGCIPTKTLIVEAEKSGDFALAMAEKEAVTSRLRQKNFATLDAVVDVYNAKGRFVSNKEVEIVSGDDTTVLSADTIIINTGAVSVVPGIEGLKESRFTFDSTGIQQLSEQPKRLGIIGGGNIGLEFASLYAKLGTKVTVFETFKDVLTREEPTVQTLLKSYLEEQGIEFVTSATVEKVQDHDSTATLTVNAQNYEFDAILFSTGRRANTDGLQLDKTDIRLTERGAIETDAHLETAVKGVFAVGDVMGGIQFTYVSLDHSRIVWDYLTGNGEYTLNSERIIPNSLFTDVPLARVGHTEATAVAAGLKVKTNEQLVATMPRAHVDADLRGVFKVVVDEATNEIVGASLLGKESPEIINLIVLAMRAHLPYTTFQNQIFTHPTMAENFNDLFNF